jgi:hypothetical protein
VTDNKDCGGVLNSKGWFGHCYTNGIEEKDNPTSIEDVKDALAKNINAILKVMKDWNGIL